MILLEILKTVNLVAMILFMVCYVYQIFYIIVACVKKPTSFPEVEKTHRYAFMISARNEEDVIGQLCDSIREQDYPAELIDIYVTADNCTDDTRVVAEEHGACVFERFNKEKVGKGYGLELLFDKVRELRGEEYYDAYFIVDADNLLKSDYVTEMDKCMSAGNRIIMCYRNSKNYGDNWISAGYSLWFLRASRHLNNARQILGLSSEISGTGFLVHRDVINRQGGWKHFLLIEDIEFTVDNVLHGERVAYCHSAVVYDEQPTKFVQSWWQRKRWSRGYLQILRHYGLKLIKGFVTGKGFSHFDMLMAISPAFFLTTFIFALNLAALIIIPIADVSCFVPTLITVGETVLSSYLLFLALGVISGVSEWKNIDAPTGKKVLSFFTFPTFMATYLPIVASSFFTKVEWKPIKHHPVKRDDAPRNVSSEAYAGSVDKHDG